ncbi:substrate-binding domain-containing protein [Verminephrobacter eiseniae]|uniref:Periplasmic binding protein/LacI transcriptional regulator n=1 Tax=Verminephrobacter eiseniae (strain EF01-2) TaxID=391735 RepID=A1WND3_VEREI|nr:substrate-binding domain-containing protein [Verminephrobacter eiseniae]ABM59140.1 periplasmic binding protein/LacI transcriptional regulator [Verminephrobacter eiseniae EF01-2]MCW5284687.1 sugar ABC transporter substrate-binding protein [Verminephrobacter eiseniae]MCW5302394.1 sugar ABC transporter substrate-binding protein [Verminephrobacter eiseniae]MCW8181202.1 sugar ABC transporter substrate-binding protein [Verminephrobacter eiseniae]MCW8190334.1 sugar ABC transporter substrate-bindin
MNRNAFFKCLAASCLCCAGFAVPAQTAGKYTVGASLLTQQHPFYIELADAMKKQAAKDGVRLDLSIANQDLNKQLSDVEDFISKKVDAIILSPVDSKGVKAAVLKAGAAGIPVITVDIAASGVAVVAHVATDNYAGGVKAGELMAQATAGKGRIGVLHYPTVQSVVDRVEGFKKALSAHPQMKIVSIQPGITRAEALTAAQNMLQAHPDLAGIFGFGDDAALAALASIKAANKLGQVKVVGFDGMAEARAAVDKEPAFVGVIRQYPDQMGARAIGLAVAVLAGKKVDKLNPVVPGVYTAAHQ